MYNQVRHEYRNRVKNSFKNKVYFFICWKICRIRDILASETVFMGNDLNRCGWTFKRTDTYNYNLYKKYQEKEELNRLFAWITNHIYECDKTNKQLDYEYILEIATDAVTFLKNLGMCNPMKREMSVAYLNMLKKIK